MPNVTVTESIVIARPAEAVWDYTQDWSRRVEWDPSITLQLRSAFLAFALEWFLRWQLGRSTREALARARMRLES